MSSSSVPERPGLDASGRALHGEATALLAHPGEHPARLKSFVVDVPRAWRSFPALVGGLRIGGVRGAQEPAGEGVAV